VRYLGPIFQLAGLSPAAEVERAQLERRLGAALPEAFAELVLTDAWPSLLRLGSEDHPHPREALGAPIRGYAGREEGLLPFMSENQGVCTWAIPLHEGPDPRVLVEVDSMPRPEWRLACESFSVWLRCRVEDGLMGPRVAYMAQAPPLSGALLAELRAAFDEGPTTHAWPAAHNYRFHGPTVDLLLWAGDDQCDWHIAPRGDDPEAALRSIPRAGEIAAHLFEV